MNFKLHFLFIWIVIFSGCASRHKRSLYNEKPGFYSYVIGDLNSEKIQAEYAADVYATPASCQKTITALLALKTLGPDYCFQTSVYTRRGDNKKTQDLLIAFSGDPTLTSENLIKLLEPLKNCSFDKIVLDTSVFSTPEHSPNNMIDDIGTAYGQPVSGAIIDKNLIVTNIVSTKVEMPAKITIDPTYMINGVVLTTAEPSDVKLAWKDGQISASGNINKDDELLELKLSPLSMAPYLLSKVENIKKNLNIQGKVEIKNEGSDPSRLNFVSSFRSESISKIISPALKKSDNLVFDTLYLKIINSRLSQNLENWSDGNKIIKELIKEHFNVDVEKANFVDGSGLSRYNRIQPRKLYEILKHGYCIREFVYALPMPGEKDSTLEKRINLSEGIAAKTGSLSGISCLCGYGGNLVNPKAFVIMASGFAPPAQELHELIDKFISENLRK